MIFQLDEDWKILVAYQATNNSASSIPHHHLRSSMSTVCCSELPGPQTKLFASPQNPFYNLSTLFSTKLSYCELTSRKTHCATVPKTNSPFNLDLNYIQTFASQPKQSCGVRSDMTARLAAQVYNVTHTSNKVRLSCFVCSITRYWSGWPSNLLHKVQLLYTIGLLFSIKYCFICPQWKPSKMIKKAFYFILKALLVLKIFKYLSWLFGHLEKTAWLER